MSQLCPFAKWVGSPNFGYPRGTHGQLMPAAICYHVMEGTLAGCDSWFNNPNSWASTHFGIGKNGEIHQYVDLKDAAWGNGTVANPDLEISYVYANHNPNLTTYSIEHEGYSGEPWPEAQYQASLRLTRWLLDNFYWHVDEPGLIGHYQLDRVNRANCPGPGWNKQRLIADLEGTMAEPFTKEQEDRIRDILTWAGPGLEMQARMGVLAALSATKACVEVGKWEDLRMHLDNVKNTARLWHRWEE